MRRLAVTAWFSMILALASALTANIAQASPALATPSFDFGRAAFDATFGESNDARAAISAAYGDRAGESPLRDLAIVVPSAFLHNDPPASTLDRLALLQEPIASLPSFAAPSQEKSGARFFAPSLSQFTPVAFYAPVPAIPVDVPEHPKPGRFPHRRRSPEIRRPPASSFPLRRFASARRLSTKSPVRWPAVSRRRR